MINKQQMQVINRKRLKYPLDIAEKDYYLALAVQLISESRLSDVLVFKGGTAIHHCYLPQHRFSEDLDFTSLDHQLSMDAVTAALESTGAFTVKKQYESLATLKVERLSYAGVLSQPGAIKVEIDRKQNVVLPPVQRPYVNVWGIEAAIQTMQIQEIVAEKIRAAATRARYRDFYDLFLLTQMPEVDLDKAVELLRQKEIRLPVSPAGIAANWQQAQLEAENEMRSIYFAQPVNVEAITQLVAGLAFAPIPPQPG
jgi:predicted nucleotidyltransferase component of viral defense system